MRWGREIVGTSDAAGGTRIPVELAVRWTNTATQALTSRGADDLAQRFLEATTASGGGALRARLAELEAIAEELRT